MKSVYFSMLHWIICTSDGHLLNIECVKMTLVYPAEARTISFHYKDSQNYKTQCETNEPCKDPNYYKSQFSDCRMVEEIASILCSHLGKMKIEKSSSLDHMLPLISH